MQILAFRPYLKWTQVTQPNSTSSIALIFQAKPYACCLPCKTIGSHGGCIGVMYGLHSGHNIVVVQGYTVLLSIWV